MSRVLLKSVEYSSEVNVTIKFYELLDEDNEYRLEICYPGRANPGYIQFKHKKHGDSISQILGSEATLSEAKMEELSRYIIDNELCSKKSFAEFWQYSKDTDDTSTITAFSMDEMLKIINQLPKKSEPNLSKELHDDAPHSPSSVAAAQMPFFSRGYSGDDVRIKPASGIMASGQSLPALTSSELKQLGQILSDAKIDFVPQGNTANASVKYSFGSDNMILSCKPDSIEAVKKLLTECQILHRPAGNSIFIKIDTLKTFLENWDSEEEDEFKSQLSNTNGLH